MRDYMVLRSMFNIRVLLLVVHLNLNRKFANKELLYSFPTTNHQPMHLHPRNFIPDLIPPHKCVSVSWIIVPKFVSYLVRYAAVLL